MRILGLPNGVNGAAYYRIFLPLTHLDRNSEHELTVPAPDNAGKLGGTWLSGHDVVVGQCIARDGAAIWQSFKDDGDGALVYETDDDLVSPIDPRHHPGLAQYNDPSLREGHIRALAMSDLVTVSTPVLAERMSRHNPNVVVLPNCVNADLLSLPRCPVCNGGHAPVGTGPGTVPAFVCPGPRPGKVTVGWHGSATHVGDMVHVSSRMIRFFERNPQVDLHIIGADYRRFFGRLGARLTPWAVNMWDFYANIDFDIGIAPLMPNSFNAAKSHIKALEYAALGIPVVASDWHPYRDFVRHGETGFLVRRDHEWERLLRDLCNDAAMREEMGAKARAHAAGYTIQEHWPEWEKAYSSLL